LPDPHVFRLCENARDLCCPSGLTALRSSTIRQLLQQHDTGDAVIFTEVHWGKTMVSHHITITIYQKRQFQTAYKTYFKHQNTSNIT
jgi:hypothetical protein